MYIAMGVRWGVEVNVLLLCTGITLSHLSKTLYVHVYKNIYVCEKNTVYVHLICVWYVTL